MIEIAAWVMAAGAVVPQAPTDVQRVLEARCVDCHGPDLAKGGLRLDALPLDPAGPLEAWFRVHEKVRTESMPPAPKPPLSAADRAALLKGLESVLIPATLARRSEGRAVRRRLTRVEYEHTLRDLLDLPALDVRQLLPEDGRFQGFSKVGEALDVSHVQAARYLQAAERALDEAIARDPEPPAVAVIRLRPHEQHMLHVWLRIGDAVPIRDGQTAPYLRYDVPQFPDRPDTILVAPDPSDPAIAAQIDAVGVLRHGALPFNRFSPTFPGRYRIRFRIRAFQWDRGKVLPARRPEAAALLATSPERGSRTLGYFTAPSDRAADVETVEWLRPGEHVAFLAASLRDVRVHGRPGRAFDHAGPGVAIESMDVEGPLLDRWPPESHRRVFGDLPIRPWSDDLGRHVPRRGAPRRVQLRSGAHPLGEPSGARFTVVSDRPEADARRLLASFAERAFRRPVRPDEVEPYVALARASLRRGESFEQAMRTACQAVLCAPDFLYLDASPGPLDGHALASRLSYFLWGSPPDDALLRAARSGALPRPDVLRGQVDRMLGDPRVARFVEDFLDQWIDLGRIDETTPDQVLYPEFDPWLRDSMLGETRAFFARMIREDLGPAAVIASDWSMLNRRLADHYGIPGVEGVEFRPVALPPRSGRGGILTHASVLKVTANGTTTSPVLRGAWVMEKLLGLPSDPPPPGAGVIEPDTRGAVTVREQLARHRNNPSCRSCHARIDPPGFALETFDVIGGWRDRYRSAEGGDPVDAVGFDGRKVTYRLAQPVDASGETADGRRFSGIGDFRRILLERKRDVFRRLAESLVLYATGAEVDVADRRVIEGWLDRLEREGGGVRSLIHELVQSPIFREK